MTGYAWASALEAFCFTAVVGLDSAEVARRLGADPEPAARRTFDECFWPAAGPQWAQLDQVHEGVLVAEHNGWWAEEHVEHLSKRATVACFYRNVHAEMRFVYAVDGSVVAEFDPLLQPRPVAGSAPAALDRALAGLSFGLFGAEPSALDLLDRLTGVPVEQDWLAARQPCVRFPTPVNR